MRCRLGWMLPVLAAGLGGCTVPPQETPAEALVRRQLDCTESGFAEGTPDFRLCVLLQQTNEHLASVDRRLTWIEQDTRFSRPYFGRGWW
jgi:hypothetical protein